MHDLNFERLTDFRNPPLGGDGNVELVLGSYQPSVICSSTLPSWRSCDAVITGMDADHQEQVFGEASNPYTQVSLPHEVYAGRTSTSSMHTSEYTGMG